MTGDALFAFLVLLCVVGSAGMMVYALVYLPKKLDERLTQSVLAFSTAIELRFPSHEGLSRRVSWLCVRVGRRMGMRQKELKDLAMAACLRDIGLCAAPYALVNEREEADWSEAERATYMRHPEVGAAILALLPSLRRLAPQVRWHHSDYAPGSGEPVYGRSLPLGARIMRVVTEYLWVERLQGDTLAREVIRAGVGKSFDPRVVDCFLAVLRSPYDAKREARIAIR